MKMLYAPGVLDVRYFPICTQHKVNENFSRRSERGFEINKFFLEVVLNYLK